MSGTSKKVTKRETASGRLLSKSEIERSGTMMMSFELSGKGRRRPSSTVSGKYGDTVITEVRGGGLKVELRPSKAALAERARRAAAAITDEEDAAITAGAMADPDALPNRYIGKRRGRPKASSTKELVTLRLDPDVLRFFKLDGDGWQTRINDALRKVAMLD
jgi:uncharacterized protein (DUF4415 family)